MEAGLIENVGDASGTNITGKVNNVPRETVVDLVLQGIKNIKWDNPVRIGSIYSDYPSSVGDLKSLQAVAKERQKGVRIIY